MSDPGTFLEQAWDILRREAMTHLGGAAAERRAAAEKMRALVGQACALYRDVGDSEGETEALRRLGEMELFAGEPKRSRDAFEAALGISNRTGDILGGAKALRGLGWAEAAAKHPDKAREVLGEAIEVFLDFGELAEAGGAQCELARAFEEMGELDAAIRMYERAHRNSAAAGDMHGAGHALWSQAELYRDAGLSEHWLDAMDRAASYFRRITDAREAIISLMSVSSSFMLAGATERHEALEREIDELREKCFQEAVQSDDVETRINALVDKVLGAPRSREGYKQAREAYEEALRLNASMGDAAVRGRILSVAAMHEARADNLKRARGFYREAIELFEESGNLRQAGDDLFEWGQMESRAGNHEEARQLLGRSLDLKRKMGLPQSEAFTLMVIGGVEAQRKRFCQSRDAYLEALALFRKIGDQANEGLTMGGMARLEAAAGNLGRAREICVERREFYRKTGEWHGEGYALRDWGNLERDAGNLDAADELYREARDLFDAYGDLKGAGGMLGRLGKLNLNRNPRSAAHYYLEAAKRFKKLGDPEACKRAMVRYRRAGGREDLD